MRDSFSNFLSRTKQKVFSTILVAFATNVASQVTITETDGDWCSQYETLTNTSQADLMIRMGDIDNMGFGYNGVDPFTQISGHTYPWSRDTTDHLGMDMIMVSNGGWASDGYSSRCKRQLLAEYGKTFHEITVPLNIDSALKIKEVVLQIHFDDVQPFVANVRYKAYINHKRAPYMDKVINSVDLSGPTGKLVSFKVPEKYLQNFTGSEFTFHMENIFKDYCEGYGIDFIKILYNPKVSFDEVIPEDTVQKKKFLANLEDHVFMGQENKEKAKKALAVKFFYNVPGILMQQPVSLPSIPRPNGGINTGFPMNK